MSALQSGLHKDSHKGKYIDVDQNRHITRTPIHMFKSDPERQLERSCQVLVVGQLRSNKSTYWWIVTYQ